MKKKGLSLLLALLCLLSACASAPAGEEEQLPADTPPAEETVEYDAWGNPKGDWIKPSLGGNFHGYVKAYEIYPTLMWKGQLYYLGYDYTGTGAQPPAGYSQAGELTWTEEELPQQNGEMISYYPMGGTVWTAPGREDLIYVLPEITEGFPYTYSGTWHYRYVSFVNYPVSYDRGDHSTGVPAGTLDFLTMRGSDFKPTLLLHGEKYTMDRLWEFSYDPPGYECTGEVTAVIRDPAALEEGQIASMMPIWDAEIWEFTNGGKDEVYVKLKTDFQPEERTYAFKKTQ